MSDESAYAYAEAFLNNQHEAYFLHQYLTLVKRTEESLGGIFGQQATRLLELAQDEAKMDHYPDVSGVYLAIAIVYQSPVVRELVPDIENRVKEVEETERYIRGEGHDEYPTEFDREALLLLERAGIHARPARNAWDKKSITVNDILYAFAESSNISPSLLTGAREQILTRLS